MSICCHVFTIVRDERVRRCLLCGQPEPQDQPRAEPEQEQTWSWADVPEESDP
jgi:hypothetical protein